MATLSKSPLHVAREALAIATKALRPYAHKYSPKLYTQPVLSGKGYHSGRQVEQAGNEILEFLCLCLLPQ